MIRSLRTLAVGAAAAALVVTATAAPADAKTRTFSDKSGDALAALDMTKVKVANKKHAVVVRMTVPGFKKSQLGSVVVMVRTKAKGRPEYMAMKSRIDGVGWLPLMLVGEDEEDPFVSCKGDKVTFGKRSVTVRIPQRCLGTNRKAVRVAAGLGGRGTAEEVVDEVPEEGPEAPADMFPSLSSTKFSPWVRYR